MGIGLTQGSIIADIRSDKYSNVRCKGIVISARCDFAQDKIKQFHYLSAMNIEDWIHEELYYTVISECIKNEKGSIKKCAEKYTLNFNILDEFGFERMKEVLNYNVQGKELKQVIAHCEKCEQYEKQLRVRDRKEKRKILSEKSCKGILVSKINSLICSAYPKFAFVPQKGYMDSKSLVHGLVVDLQDIHQVDIKFGKGILSNEYDYQTIKDDELKRALNKYFFFENDDDFIIVEGLLQSPWIEYVLQLFAYSFTRIGVDNASKEEIEAFCNYFLEEN